jgi:hypothetical protein
VAAGPLESLVSVCPSSVFAQPIPGAAEEGYYPAAEMGAWG